MPVTQSPPDMSRRPSKGAEGDDEAQDNDTEATAGDLYGMLAIARLAPGQSPHSNGWPSA